MIMVLYVDELVMTGNHEEKISQTKWMMGREFEMTDLTDAFLFGDRGLVRVKLDLHLTIEVCWRDTKGIWHG